MWSKYNLWWKKISSDVLTAIPEEPFNNKFGSLAGRRDGSLYELSKFGTKSTCNKINDWNSASTEKFSITALNNNLIRTKDQNLPYLAPNLPRKLLLWVPAGKKIANNYRVEKSRLLNNQSGSNGSMLLAMESAIGIYALTNKLRRN